MPQVKFNLKDIKLAKPQIKGINSQNILALTKKELRTILDNPASYIVFIGFVILWQFLFFRNAFLILGAILPSK